MFSDGNDILSGGFESNNYVKVRDMYLIKYKKSIVRKIRISILKKLWLTTYFTLSWEYVN
jgi:hypothetical protein